MTPDRARILLAHGDTEIRVDLSGLLLPRYAVTTLADGHAVLPATREQRPDLLLLQVALPGVGGLDLLRQCRADTRLRDLPVILLADPGDEEPGFRGFRIGADDCLISPFGAAELHARIAHQLQRAGERRDAATREQQLGAIFNQASTGIVQTDLSGRHLMANQRYAELVGRSLPNVLLQRIQDFIHPDDLAANAARWTRMAESGEDFAIELRLVRPDGAVVWANNCVALLRDPAGAPQSALVVLQDVTERKRAESALAALTATLEQRIEERTRELAALNSRLSAEVGERRQAELALRREEAFSELVIESSAEGIVAIDAGMRHTLWNASAEAMTGLPRSAVLGRSVGEVFPQALGTPVEQAWRAALQGRGSTLRDRAFAIPSSGRSGLYDASFAPLHGIDGTIIGALALMRDVTEPRRIEDALRQAQKMEAVGQLTGGVAHDFNNLLTVITGNLETLKRRLPADAEDWHRLAAAALRGTDRAATLTRQLLAFSRRQPLDPKPIEPNKLVSGMSELMRRTLGESIEVETVLAGGVWRARCDPNQLESAILNLAVNARDAMRAGGKLTIETANAWLDDGYAAAHADVIPGQYVVISVSDTGTGMTRDVVARAFEPFFTTKEVGQGTGLGLSQVYGFVKQSGGHVKIYSEPGEGSTVKLYLPRLFEAVAETESTQPAAPVPGAAAAETILVVEDDEDVRQYSVELLGELGYRALEAADGTQALALLDDAPEILLMFTDVALPGGMNGRELAEAAQRRRPDLKILFTTGYARNAVVHQGTLEPGVELISKPFTYAHLAAKIRTLLGRGRG